jgi:hypothetical protein
MQWWRLATQQEILQLIDEGFKQGAVDEPNKHAGQELEQEPVLDAMGPQGVIVEAEDQGLLFG